MLQRHPRLLETASPASGIRRRAALAGAAGLAAALVAGSAAAVERACGPDARANVADVLCAPPSGPCDAGLVRVSADVTTASASCRFDLEGRALVVERTIESEGDLRFERCTTLTLTATGKVKSRGDFRRPGDGVVNGGAVRFLCTGAVAHHGTLDVSGDPGGLIELEVGGDVVLAAGSLVRGDGASAVLDEGERAGDGGSLEIYSLAGGIDVRGAISLRGQAAAAGGAMLFEAAHDLVLDGSLDLSGGTGGGGVGEVVAGRDVTMRGAVTASSRAGGDFGGLVYVEAGRDGLGTIAADDVVFDLRGSSANESGGSGGDLELSAQGTVRLGPGTVVRLDAGTQLDGDAGTLLIAAGDADDVLEAGDGDIVLQGLVSARGGNAEGTSGTFAIELAAGRNVLLAGPIVSHGSDYGGDVLVEAGGAVTVAASVSATASDAEGVGGSIQIVAGLATSATLTVGATIDASGGRAGGGDTILLGGCAIDVAAGTTIDGRGGPTSDGAGGGADMELLWRHALTIGDDARLLAGPGGSIRLLHAPGSLDTIGAGVVFDPAPSDEPHPGVPGFLPCPAAVCGNGVVEPGEACDDGNVDDADGCSSSCAPQCAPVPTTGCRALVPGGSGRLLVSDETRDGRDALQWKWTGGAATPLAALGDPITRDAYRLCLYDLAAAPPVLRLSAVAPAAGLCGGRACWRVTGGQGFRYHDRARTPDGLDRLELRAGPAGKAKMRVTGRGEHLALPPLPLALPARVQLHGRDGECWETLFDAAGTTRNDARRFKARAVLPTPGPTATGPTPTPTRTPTRTRTPTPPPTPDLSTLARLELLPRQVTREIGKMVRFTTIGHLADGSLVDVSQHVQYLSSDPTVAVATNQPGDRSRVDTAAAGAAAISAVHAATGVTTGTSGDDAALTVLGILERVTLAPASATIVPGETLALAATGHYAGGGALDLTHRVDYRSSVPAIVVAPNQAGAKHVVTGVAPGTATISAVDPLTGVATGAGDGDATLEVVPLVRLAVTPAVATVELLRSRGFAAIGHYADGSTRNLTTRITFASSDPATAVIDANRAAGLALGSVTISAHDPTTGIGSTASGDDATLEVVPIAGLRLEPSVATISVGGFLFVQVLARFQDGSERVVGEPEVVLTSSDAGVAIPNASGRFVRGLGPGGATITATGGGVTSTASGGDLTLTVIP